VIALLIVLAAAPTHVREAREAYLKSALDAVRAASSSELAAAYT
jgi:hypothetical protein